MNEIEVVKRSYYAIIPANVRYDKELTPNAKLLYGEITALCNEKGYCWAGNSYFADLYSVSNKSISKWVNQLISKRYITTEIKYKDGTKQILHRYLRIANTPMEEMFHTYPKDVPYPMEEKVKDNNTSNNTNNKKTANQDLLVVDFEKLWKLYPNKKGNKETALKAYKKALKGGTTNKQIQDGIVAYKKHLAENDWLKPAFGSAWFFNCRWNDEYESESVTQKMTDEEMGGNDKYQQYIERKGLAAANNQQPTA